jgi:AraC-like DNA-binding protein/mannose-6-phosphate isomerase-like protein (cupin superfamily)
MLPGAMTRIDSRTSHHLNTFTVSTEHIDLQRPLVVHAKEFHDGETVSPHRHNCDQFLYASVGVMTVTTVEGIWVVPPMRAVWIPAGTVHTFRASGVLMMKTLYIQPEHVAFMPATCRVLSVTGLLRELILRAAECSVAYPENGLEARLVQVILDQFHLLDEMPLALPVPVDDRLQRICDRLSRNPGDQRTLDAWGKIAGATGRTLARLCTKELGMTFRQWRQQIRLLEALRRLGRNEPVTAVAMDLGYDSPSAFITMFKKALGKTPGHYFDDSL